MVKNEKGEGILIKKKYLIPLNDILLLLLFIYIIIYYGQSFLNGDTDLLWHIKQGDWLFENRKIVIDRELFTYQFDYREWIYLSWIADIILALVYKISEFRGIIVFTSIIISSYIYILYRYVIKEGAGIVKTLAILIFTLPILQMSWLPRPYIFSYIFMAIWLVIVDGYCNGNKKKMIWVLPVIGILWVNVQSSFVYGFVILGLYLAGDFFDFLVSGDKIKLKNSIVLFIIMLLNLVTSAINPFGLKNYKVLFFTNNDYMYKSILEFASVNFHNIGSLNLYILFFIITIMFFLKKNIKTSYIFLILFWLYSGMEYIRHMAIFGFFAIAIIPLISDYSKLKKFMTELIPVKIKTLFQKWIVNKKNIDFNNTRFPIIAIIGFVVVFALTLNVKLADKMNWNLKPTQPAFGMKGTEYIKKNNLKGRIYNNYLYGGYMIWEFYPERVVFIDPRASIYPKEVFLDHRFIASFSEDAFERLDKYNIKYLFIDVKSNLAEAVKIAGKNYKEIYKDKSSVIYEKTGNGVTDEKNQLK